MVMKPVKLVVPLFALQVAVIIEASLLTNDASLELVGQSCKNKLDFKTIAEYLEFVRSLKSLDEQDLLNSSSDTSIKRCQNEKESIYALDALVEQYDRKRPCKFDQIGKLEAFAKSHLLGRKRPLVMKFFTLFGVNIGLVCKLNLLAHVRQADTEADQSDFIYSLASPTGWNVLINELTKKSMKFGTSSHAGSSVIYRVTKLIPGLSRVDQLDYMSFDHALNFNKLEDWNGIERGSQRLATVQVTSKVHEFLSKIIQSCMNLDQFYVNLTLSLARLNELGLLVGHEILNELHEFSVELHKWLAATSFCQLMTRVRVGFNQTDEISLEVLHHDSLVESRNTLYSYEAEFDEISKEALESVWLASVSDSQWCQKNQAMFRSDDGGKMSVAMKQLNQFIRGVERDYQTSEGNREGSR